MSVRYVTLAAAGCVAVLPVAVIMIWYKDWSLASVPMNDYLNVVWKVTFAPKAVAFFVSQIT